MTYTEFAEKIMVIRNSSAPHELTISQEEDSNLVMEIRGLEEEQHTRDMLYESRLLGRRVDRPCIYSIPLGRDSLNGAYFAGVMVKVTE